MPAEGERRKGLERGKNRAFQELSHGENGRAEREESGEKEVSLSLLISLKQREKSNR